MGNTSPVKYPSYNGEIDRIWLTQQVAQASRPNLLVAIALHPYYSSTICNFAHVTADVLIDFLLGRDDLTLEEFSGLLQALSNYNGKNINLLFDHELKFTGNAEAIQHARNIIDDVMQRYNHPALPILAANLRKDIAVQAVIDSAIRFEAWAAFLDAHCGIDSRPKHRSTRLEV